MVDGPSKQFKFFQKIEQLIQNCCKDASGSTLARRFCHCWKEVHFNYYILEIVNCLVLQQVHVVPQVVTLVPITHVSGCTGSARHVTCPGFNVAFLQSQVHPFSPILQVGGWAGIISQKFIRIHQFTNFLCIYSICMLFHTCLHLNQQHKCLVLMDMPNTLPFQVAVGTTYNPTSSRFLRLCKLALALQWF